MVLKDEDDDDDELLDLKERLAAYNLESSPDHSEAMETEVPTRKKEPSRRKAAAKKPSSDVAEISDDEDEKEDISDNDFELEVVEEAIPEVGKKKGGRKPAAAKKPPAPTKKRGPAANKSQKLITEVLKPAANSGISPEKKVRKMRASPFNKKSGSVLGRTSKEDESVSTGSDVNLGSNSTAEIAEDDDTSEVVAVKMAARPQRANRGKATYVLSDTESDEVQEDSDFEEDDDAFE